MCKAINTVPSLVWLRRTVRRWRSRAACAAASVPAGHVAVRVEGGRFAVRLAHLGHPEFQELLRQAEEEYGFPPGAFGPLALPCDEHRRVSSPSSDGFEERHPLCRCRGMDSRPLLQGMAMEKLVS